MVNETMLMEEFENLLDEMYLTFHYHQTNIPHYDISDAERSEMSYYDSLGSHLADEIEQGSNHKSKIVNFHSDPKYCNGLPRRR